MAEGAPPLFDVRARWRAGRVALAVAGVLAAVALLRPFERALGPPWLRLGLVLLVGLGLIASALLASLRGRGPLEQLAFYAFLTLALDALAQAARPAGWPAWPLMTLLLAGVAVAEPLATALGVAGLAAVLAGAEAAWMGDWRAGLAAGLGYFALVAAVNRALAGEKRRLLRISEELARLKYGIGQLEDRDDGTGTGPIAPLRRAAAEARLARQAEHSEELGESIRKLVGLARSATGAHAVVYFEVDRTREVAFVRAAAGPESLAQDASVPLGEDPFAFVLERRSPFYATDYRRLLWSLPWYRGEVKLGSLLALPVRTGEVVAAVLVADSLEIQSLNGGEPELLSGFAGLIADAVQGSRALQSREDMTSAFEAAQDQSRRLAVLKDAANVCRLLLRSAQQVASPEMAAVVLADDPQSRYTVRHAFGWAQAFEGREVALDEKTWAAWVVRSAEEPLLRRLNDAGERMPILVLDEAPAAAEALLVLPLRERNGNVGALVLTGREDAFGAVTRQVLQMIANQAAAVLGTIRLIEKQRDLAIRDGLTGLLNRRAFQELLRSTTARHDRLKDGSFGLILLDIDHFKKLNDTHGHPAGDEALRQVARALHDHARAGDEVARYGGEEFAVVLPSADARAAHEIAERLRREIERTSVRFAGGSIRLTASFGVAVWPADGRDPETLLSAADKALYAAKQGGRNRVAAAGGAA
jgi:diguanylate cyclase (GGDEF)-like protein